mmetsp:Transcript_59805/g.106318  ORF Transcript_59805/g.106318 Transcript_59805/m.106318 type:complete len:223 (-) Transcript_59805:141-809(-)
MISVTLSLTKLKTSSSFSTAATAFTTSQRIPMSMFMTQREPPTINTMKRPATMKLSRPISDQTTVKLSRNVPWISKVYMECWILLKYFRPLEVPSETCLKMMEKMYMSISRSVSVSPTDLVAAKMPLSMIRSSGNARSIRASLDNRRSRSNRRRLACPPKPEPPPWMRITTLITHVSPTIKATRQLSKTNHGSCNPLESFAKAMYRTNHSKEKKAQKKFSAT